MRNPTIGMFVGDAEIERRERRQMTTDQAKSTALEPCCGWDVQRDYIVMGQSEALKCPDCGKVWRTEDRPEKSNERS